MKFVQIEGDTATIVVEDYFTVVKVCSVGVELSKGDGTVFSKVIVDFLKTKYIDSSCISELINIVRHVGADNFAIQNANGKVATALRGANLMGWVKDQANG